MIQALDHVSLIVDDVDEAVAGYELLLGRRCRWRGTDDATAHAWFPLANMALGIFARVRPTISGDGPGAIAFAVADMEAARRLAARRGLETSPPRVLQATHCDAGAEYRVLVATLPAAATHGVAMQLARADAPFPGSAPAGDEASAMSGLDHVVMRSPNPERAIALIAGRLDLELRLDRTNPEWGARLLFFRCGDLVVEVAHDLAAGVTDGPDEFWGLSWRTPDLDAAQARLVAAGIEVSGIRSGRRAGTRVFTIRDRIARVPTLVIGR